MRRDLLRGLARDVAGLFPPGDVTSLLLAATTLLQLGYWYLGAPGPATPREPLQALVSVAWAVLLLGLVPWLLLRPLGLVGRRMGLARGDLRSGLALTALGLVAVLPLAWFAAGDPAIRLTYPWPGPQIAAGPGPFLAWAVIYALYYLAYEFFYRGLLLRGLEPTLGRFGALWFQTVASTLLHLGKPLLEALAALPAGLLFGLIALRTRSILYVFLIHLGLGLATDLFSLMRAGSAG